MTRRDVLNDVRIVNSCEHGAKLDELGFHYLVATVKFMGVLRATPNN